MGASEKYPTAMALVMARMMKRVAAKHADLGLARLANSLHKEALSALRNRQSALSNPRPTPTRGQEASTTPALDPKSLKDRARLPTPSELDSWSAGLEGLQELLTEKQAKERMQAKYRTAAALVMARMLKRIAVKYTDFGLARRAKYLEKEALSALKNWQSALSNPREINAGRQSATLALELEIGSGPVTDALRARRLAGTGRGERETAGREAGEGSREERQVPDRGGAGYGANDEAGRGKVRGPRLGAAGELP